VSCSLSSCSLPMGWWYVLQTPVWWPKYRLQLSDHWQTQVLFMSFEGVFVCGGFCQLCKPMDDDMVVRSHYGD